MAFVLRASGGVDEAAAAGAFFWAICKGCGSVDAVAVSDARARGPFKDMAALEADLRRRATCRNCGGTDCELDYRGPKSRPAWTGNGKAPAAIAARPAEPIVPAESCRAREIEPRIDAEERLRLVAAFFDSFRPPHLSTREE